MNPPGRLERFNRVKRFCDVALVVVAMPVLVLPGLLAVLITAVGLGRPLIFRQVRLGLDGVPFELLKFRTMIDARDPSGTLLPDGQRLPPAGRFLRKTSLDELPQLLNVLRGEMSLIGPRPLYVHYGSYYLPHERRRHDVRPGITGRAQVSGRNGILWDERLRLDAEYVQRARLRDDFGILIATFRQTIFGHEVAVVARESGEPLDVVRSYPQKSGYALRRFEYVDIPKRVEWFRHPTTLRYMSLTEEVTVESTTAWLRRARTDRLRHDFTVYQISTGEPVAVLGIRRRHVGDKPELYMVVDPSLRGRGLGTIALELLVDWMKAKSDFSGCYLTVAEANVAAIAIYRRRGFRVIGRSDDTKRIAMEVEW